MPSRSRQLHAFLLLYFGRLSHTKACDGVTSERREYSVHRYDKYTTGRSCANNSKYCRYNRFETKGKIDHKKTEKIRVHYWICICSAFSAIFCFYISIGGDDFTIFRPPQNRSWNHLPSRTHPTGTALLLSPRFRRIIFKNRKGSEWREKKSRRYLPPVQERHWSPYLELVTCHLKLVRLQYACAEKTNPEFVCPPDWVVDAKTKVWIQIKIEQKIK